MRFAAVVYLIRQNEGRTEVCLARKKRKYGAEWLHGYGGIIVPPETSSQCAARECREESTVQVSEAALRRIAVVSTFTWQGEPWRVHMFRCDSWTGEPKESDECGPPEWFAVSDLPYDRMFPDREYWMDRALRGSVVHAQIWLSENGREVHMAHLGALPEEF
ncbi:MAG TPA: NUDIX domain-containing protein [Candidatus Paceibacterota bacterium]|jgi:8-oxo-dGTP pyrophosphatase MutT (NUDIX family)|nr:NUDIX domain-containing protein [Candidatus Paceibacterota bacterium]